MYWGGGGISAGLSTRSQQLTARSPPAVIFSRPSPFPTLINPSKPQPLPSVKDGPFLEAVKAAKRHASGTVVLVIDEVNRCLLSKVMGDLVDLLYRRHATQEPGPSNPRRLRVQLQYSGDIVSQLPENLVILGTMNTFDRSLVRIGAELRQSFAFVAMDPRLPDSPLRHVVRRKFRQDSLRLPDELKARAVSLGEVADRLLEMANDKLKGTAGYIGPSHVLGVKCFEEGWAELQVRRGRVQCHCEMEDWEVGAVARGDSVLLLAKSQQDANAEPLQRPAGVACLTTLQMPHYTHHMLQHAAAGHSTLHTTVM